MPSVLGMGISGPVLAFLTATMFAAFRGICHWGDGAYAVIMLILSGLLAVFPAVKSEHSRLLAFVMWPIATVVIFASAWGANTGMSAGEEAISNPGQPQEMVAAPLPPPAGGVPMAPTTSTNWLGDGEAMVTPDTNKIVFCMEQTPFTHQGRFFHRMR
jgi:hypothetical protein